MNYEEEESYWFLKWIAMRYERNKLRKENQALISQINEISKKYKPIKTKIHNGNTKRNKGYGR